MCSTQPARVLGALSIKATLPALPTSKVTYLSLTKSTDMNNSTTKTAFLTLSSFLAILALATAMLGSAHATGVASYSFNLVSPNSAKAENTVRGTPIVAGDVLRLTGSGAFDGTNAIATGGGSFTHYKPDGSVFARGTWLVTGFQSFKSYGGPQPGGSGGLLLLTMAPIHPQAKFTRFNPQ